MISARILNPLLQFLLLVVGGLQIAVLDGVLTPIEGWQFAALTVGAIVTWLAPLSAGKWPAVFKVLGAAVLGGIAALIPLLEGEGFQWNLSTILIVALAALQAFAAEVGVDARVHAVEQGFADTRVVNSAVQGADPEAFAVFVSR